ncbi:unnamed protein product [Lampetra fluviatilis]
MTSEGTIRGIRKWLEAVGIDTSLQCCSLTDKSSSSFTDILKANTGLKKLVLSGNKIRDSGIQHLADGMAGRKVHLEELE